MDCFFSPAKTSLHIEQMRASTPLFQNAKSASKRLSTHCMMLDSDDNPDPKSSTRVNKANRGSIFTGSLFARVSAAGRTRAQSI